MKRAFYGITVLVFVAFCAWLALRQSAQKITEGQMTPNQLQPTSAAVVPIVLNAPLLSQPLANTFVRPEYIEEDHWNQLMLVRKMALLQNQPIEFYARVLDQNDQPVDGAMLLLKLTRTNEKLFETTNFFSRQMGDEVLIIPFELFSDSNGWIRLTTNGYFLNLWGLSKEGYSSSYPNGNFAGVHYELSGARTPTQDILMTNSWNPDKGFILHLNQK